MKTRNWKKGDTLTIRTPRYNFYKQEGLHYDKMTVIASEDGFTGGWDVFDGIRIDHGDRETEISFYGFSVERIIKPKHKDTIDLFISSCGDTSVGIGREQVKITMPAHYATVEPYRKEVKALFADAVENLFETNVGDIFFSDECPDCGKQYETYGRFCVNKDCVSNS